MSWWPFGRKPTMPRPVNPSPTFDLERQASEAFFAKRWTEAERLCTEVLAKADREGRQAARNMLGKIYEKQGRIDDAIATYEANVAERSPFVAYFERLAIIYRRQGRTADERRILSIAVETTRSPKGRQWYTDRLRKMAK